MAAAIESDDAWTLPAVPSSVGQARRRAVAFASAIGVSDEIAGGVALAVSETVTNAVVHAYARREPGPVSLRCRADRERLVIEVIDEGAGVAARHDSPGIGYGLAMVGAVVQRLDVAPRPDEPGTIVTMSFAAAAHPRSPHGCAKPCRRPSPEPPRGQLCARAAPISSSTTRAFPAHPAAPARRSD